MHTACLGEKMAAFALIWRGAEGILREESFCLVAQAPGFFAPIAFAVGQVGCNDVESYLILKLPV